MTTSQTVSARPASAGAKLFQNDRGEPEQQYDRRQCAPPVAGDGADGGGGARDDQADQGDEAVAFQTPKNKTKNDAEQQRDGDFGERDERGVCRFVCGQIPRRIGRQSGAPFGSPSLGR